jgi:signal transduction protein with GAF and PtsI domain
MSAVLTVRKPIRRPSLSEFADQFELAIKERDEIAVRLNKALDDLTSISQLYERTRADFENERQRLNTELASLRTQMAELWQKKEKPVSADDVSVKSLLATQERLIRDEFEKKYQELTVQVRTQRKKYTQQVDDMKRRLSSCMCRASVRKF